jgi:charged multivesicular body protein 1
MFAYNDETMNRVVNMRMLKRKLEMLSKRCMKDSNKSMRQCKLAMSKGDVERTRLYGSYIVEKQEESIQYLHQSFMVDGVLRSYQKMLTNNNLTKSMSMLAEEMGKEFNTETTMAMILRMEKLQESDECMKIQMELTSNTSTGMSQSLGMNERIDDVLKKLADDNAMDLQSTFLSVNTSTVTVRDNDLTDSKDLAKRLDKLKQ